MPLPTQPYKGARDFYPDDKRRLNYLFSVIRKTCASFGYEEYDAPLIEPFELYAAKSGQEIVSEQTYTFTDRGGRQVAIRPEMTPSVSRMVAARRQELAYPLRWFSIPNLWRYERPQRGRLREHWQLNVDLFGLSSVEAEIELLQLVDQLFKNFKASPAMYELRLNHRGLMNRFFASLGLDDTQAEALAKLIDRSAKISQEDFLSQLDEILFESQKTNSAAEQVLQFLKSSKIDQLPGTLKDSEEAAQLSKALTSLADLGITNARFDPSIMRGFDYYTGLVFEVMDTHPDNNRSMLGGGRYDGLVGLFGVEPVPTVGFGLGDVTLANFLTGHGLLPEDKPLTDVYVAVIADDHIAALKEVAKLRADGVNAAVDLSGRRLGDQLKAADKKGIRFAMVIGNRELSEGLYSLKDLADGSEESHALDRIASMVLDYRRRHK